jgi:hypothetical protein
MVSLPPAIVRVSLFVLVLLLVPLGFFSGTAYAQSVPVFCNEGDFPLLRRGPLTLTTEPEGGAYLIAFVPNQTAARTTGDGLRRGNCAWADRPMTEVEVFNLSPA